MLPLIFLEKRPFVNCIITGITDKVKNLAYGWTNYHQIAYDGTDDEIPKMDPEHIDIEDDFEQTPAWVAAHQCKPDTLLALYERGANMHQRDSQGRTLFHATASGTCNEYYLAAAVVLGSGVDPYIKDVNGNTVFDDLQRSFGVVNWETFYMEENNKQTLEMLNQLIEYQKTL